MKASLHVAIIQPHALVVYDGGGSDDPEEN